MSLNTDSYECFDFSQHKLLWECH